MASTQEIVRIGEPLDMYYYSADTCKKSAFPTTQNTKYQVNFSNLGAGTSSFLFPPQNGLQDIVVTFSFAGIPSGSFSPLSGLALPAGWGYGLIKSCAFRYGGTSQYVLSGDQLLQNALRDQTSRTSCDDIVNIGGNYASGTDLQNTQTASVVLRLPHASASGVAKMLPFPTDLLTQSCQVLLEINPPASVWTNMTNSPLPSQSLSLAQAYFQCQQVMFNNMGDSLARRVDLSSKAYNFPCEFVQQKAIITLDPRASPSAPQSVTLSGFRSGSLRSIQIWLTDLADQQTSSSGAVTAYNPNKFYAPTSVECLYAGDIYAKYDNGVGQLFNLLNSNKASAFDLAIVSTSAGSVNNPLPFLSQWLELPFAQPLCDEDSHYILMHGRTITNGIINLNNLVVPYVSSVGWQLNCSFVYSASLLFSQGSCDYCF